MGGGGPAEDDGAGTNVRSIRLRLLQAWGFWVWCWGKGGGGVMPRGCLYSCHAKGGRVASVSCPGFMRRSGRGRGVPGVPRAPAPGIARPQDSIEDVWARAQAEKEEEAAAKAGACMCRRGVRVWARRGVRGGARRGVRGGAGPRRLRHAQRIKSPHPPFAEAEATEAGPDGAATSKKQRAALSKATAEARARKDALNLDRAAPEASPGWVGNRGFGGRMLGRRHPARRGEGGRGLWRLMFVACGCPAPVPFKMHPQLTDTRARMR